MKVGILGAGAMGGSVISHLKETPGVDSILAQDVRPERIPELEALEVEATTDLDRVLQDDNIPLVFITASNFAHHDLTLAALAAGKAVMCEKPMATTLAEAREMVEAAEAKNGYLQIGFELHYSKMYMKIKEWVDAGLLGDVINTHCYYGSSAWPKGIWRNSAELGGSMFGEKLSHYVDLPRWWIGSEVVDVYSACAPNIMKYMEVHDNYHTTYRFANGAVSHLTFMMGQASTFRGDPLQNIIDQQLGDGHSLGYIVVGTKGAAEVQIFGRYMRRWEYGDAPDTMTSDWVEDLTWDPEEDHLYYHNTLDQTKDIVRRVQQGLPPATPARDALETMRLCFAADISAEQGRVVKLSELD
ncbi:MAG TPA: Gfo/Idh/MocA family oxidoreductase [Armatimonadota bacterium]|jgi:predicted dehydrogenase